MATDDSSEPCLGVVGKQPSKDGHPNAGHKHNPFCIPTETMHGSTPLASSSGRPNARLVENSGGAPCTGAFEVQDHNTDRGDQTDRCESVSHALVISSLSLKVNKIGMSHQT